MNNKLNNDEFEELAKLLPWYVTGLLSVEDHQRVKNYLEHSSALRALLSTEEKLIELVRKDETVLDQSLEGVTEHRLERVLDVINQEQAIKEGELAESHSKRGLLSSLKAWFTFGGGSKFQYAAFASLSLGFLALLVAFVSPLLTQTQYTPASVHNEPVEGSKNTVILVGLSAERNDEKLKEVIAGMNAEIHKVPNKDGMYRIRFSKKLSPSKTQELINKLSNHKDLFWFTGEAY